MAGSMPPSGRGNLELPGWGDDASCPWAHAPCHPSGGPPPGPLGIAPGEHPQRYQHAGKRV